MSTRSLKEQLMNIRNGHDRIGADPAWVRSNRDLLLSQIRNTVEPRSTRSIFSKRLVGQFSHAVKLFVPANLATSIRSMSFVSLALLLAVSGWIASVSAAQNSLPGDALYNVKLAGEKTELLVVSVVGGQKNKVDTLFKHASNRVEELHKSKNTDQAKIVIQSLKQSIESASQSLQQANDASTPDASVVAKTVNEKTEQLLTSLGTPVVSATEPAIANQAAVVDLQKEVGEAAHLIEVTGVKAVQVLAEQNLAGDQTVSEEDVKASVEKKLDSLVSDFSEINKDVSDVNTIVASSTVGSASVSIVITSADTSTALGIFVSASGTAPIVPVTSAVSAVQGMTVSSATVGQTVKATEQRVAEANKIVEKTVAEAKTLIQNNDLVGALKKVEALTDVKKETGNAVIQAKLITESATANSALSSPNAATAPTASTTPASVPAATTKPVLQTNVTVPAPTSAHSTNDVPVSVQSIKLKSGQR
ncbi:MAG: hypothetical protein KBD73_01535 [Candidatus Magasanikbacteria bacterium]|nr:hypothetical protein [Candidatus Magasanikbacteria bacterium]